MMSRFLRAAGLAVLLAMSATALAQDEDGEEEEAPDEAPAATNAVDFAAVQAGALEAWVEPEGSTASEEEILDAVNYTMGMTTYVIYHEMGHALLRQLNIPTIGTEEDAVDIFGALYMIAEDDDPVLDDMIGAVIEARFDQDTINDGYVAGWDSHSATEQRAYQVVCMLVGSDYEGWHEVATEAEMPEQRQKDCAWEYKRAVEGWSTLLAPYELEDDEQSPNGVDVVYGEPLPEHEAIAAILQSSGMGEAVAQHIESMFRLPVPITISFYSCGEMTADWNDQTLTARLCYEYADFFRQNAIKSRTGDVKAGGK